MYGLEPVREIPDSLVMRLQALNKALMGRCALFVGEVVKDQELSSCNVIVLEMTIKKAV